MTKARKYHKSVSDTLVDVLMVGVRVALSK